MALVVAAYISTWDPSLEMLYFFPFNSMTLESLLSLSLIKLFIFLLVEGTTSLVFLVPVVARVDCAVSPTDSGLVLLICGFPLLQDYSGQSHQLFSFCLAAQVVFDWSLPWQAVLRWLSLTFLL
jgi:hypothetical protein